MKSKAMTSLVTAALFATSAAAFAQGAPDGHGPQQAQGAQQGGAGHGGQGDHGGPANQGAQGNHGGPGGPGGQDNHGMPGGHGGEQANNGPVPHRDWHKGGRVPQAYRGGQHEVSDWQDHGLHAPPRGYHWIDVNGDYVLAGIATGVISSILLAPHH